MGRRRLRRSTASSRKRSDICRRRASMSSLATSNSRSKGCSDGRSSQCWRDGLGKRRPKRNRNDLGSLHHRAHPPARDRERLLLLRGGRIFDRRRAARQPRTPGGAGQPPRPPGCGDPRQQEATRSVHRDDADRRVAGERGPWDVRRTCDRAVDHRLARTG